jgi:hypothetical protein
MYTRLMCADATDAFVVRLVDRLRGPPPAAKGAATQGLSTSASPATAAGTAAVNGGDDDGAPRKLVRMGECLWCRCALPPPRAPWPWPWPYTARVYVR